MSGLGLLGHSAVLKQSQQPRDQPLCPELIATVVNFKNFLSEQKKLRDELVNLSQQPLLKLKDELSSMMQQVSVVTAGLRRIAAQRDRLKEEVRKEEANMATVQRNADSGSIAQYDNNTTIEYFLKKLMEFDTRMRSYKQELEVLEEIISSQNRCCLSPKDLVSLLRQMDNEFICLAAQLHTAYEQIKVLKTRYLRSLRSTSGDSRNPFSEVEAASVKLRQLDSNVDLGSLNLKRPSGSRTPYGPIQFSATSNATAPLLANLSSQTVTGLQPPLLGIQPTGLPGQSTLGGLGLSSSSLSQQATTQPTLGLTGSFQLNPMGVVTSSSTLPTFGLGLNTSTSQKPLFGFGLGSSVTNTTAGIGGTAFGSTTQSVVAPVSSLGFGVSTSTASNPGVLFGTGLSTAPSTGDGAFGKQIAAKPTSLFLPKS